MNKMKKFISMLLMGMMVMGLAACSSSTSETKDASSNNDGYVFSYNNVDVTMDQKAEEVVKKLGDAVYFEAPSCADNSVGKTYTYGDGKVEVGTYQSNGTDLVGYVYVKDASVPTKEGVKVGDTVDAIKKAYPDAADSAGIYECKKGNMTLKFIITDGAIEEIDYCSNATKA